MNGAQEKSEIRISSGKSKIFSDLISDFPAFLRSDAGRAYF